MKRNIRKIPDDVFAKLKSLNCDEIVVGCAVKFKSDALASGLLAHLGVVHRDKHLILPASIIPPTNRGRYSTQNIEGEEVVRRDLPKETDYNTFESPNWGDWSNGSHTVYLPFERYPREFRPPRELSIAMNCQEANSDLPSYVIAFRVEEVLSQKGKEFKRLLFENLNLLQENVGHCSVEPAESSLQDYAKSLRVAWDILPPGSRDEAIDRIFRGRTPTVDEKDTAGERYDFFMSLKPKSLVYGSSGFRRYFGALLEDDLVVFENIRYGNAVYVLFKNWEELSKRSRLELLSGRFGTDFKRVSHGIGWKGQVRDIIAARRDNGKDKAA